MKILIHFRHGLGDAAQFTTVLQHLKKHRSNWTVDVSTLIGKHSAFHGLCNNIFVEGRNGAPCCQYKQKYFLDWHECHVSYPDSPSTKAERCLRDDFGIPPDPELCRYFIHRGDDAMSLARKYLERVCQSGPRSDGRYPAVLIHYEGNTSAEHKNIPTEIIRRLCHEILEAGFTPIILDWDYRTSLANPNPDGTPSRIHCAHVKEELWRDTGTGDAEALAALTELSSLMIGVDSGPLHVAGATSTPTLGVWTRHHPLHYFGHSDNVTHLVPTNHADLIRGDKPTGEAYFQNHYRFQTYRDLEDSLRVAVRSRLDQNGNSDGLIFARGFWIRENNGEQDLVVVRDISDEDSYRIDEIPLQSLVAAHNGELPASRRDGPAVVVDVGGHIGCFSKRIHQRFPDARIFTIECCPENISVLQKNVGDFATVMQAAVTYEPNVALLNAVYTNCRSTGGSAVISRDELLQRVSSKELEVHPGTDSPSEYWADLREMRTMTLEALMRDHEFDWIDVLKLDCEGSEFSILGKTPSLDRIGLIVGEYHGKENFLRLVADRFADWELRILLDGDLGTFWLINPALRGVGFQAAILNGDSKPPASQPVNAPIDPSYDPSPEVTAAQDPHVNGQYLHRDFPLPIPVSRTGLINPASQEEFRTRLLSALHPLDSPQVDILSPYYFSLFQIARELMPQRIVELGVRAGYSALAMFLANPEATVIGIDADRDEQFANGTHGSKGLWRRAQAILKSFDFHFLLADSKTLGRLPDADLIYIDGDHSFSGCLNDLRLAQASSARILVDDYDSIPSVRRACDTFTSEHPEFHRRYIDNGLTGFLVLERSAAS